MRHNVDCKIMATKLLSSGVWTDVRGGDGMECIIDYTDVNTQYKLM